MSKQEKREKVIKGLKCCMGEGQLRGMCDECPYNTKNEMQFANATPRSARTAEIAEGGDDMELKKCPFCGSAAKLVEDRNAYKVFCASIHCDAQYGWCKKEEDVISGWNRRMGYDMSGKPLDNVVRVVRCKDCKHRWHSINCQMYSEGMKTPDDWYCADGEQRDDE